MTTDKKVLLKPAFPCKNCGESGQHWIELQTKAMVSVPQGEEPATLDGVDQVAAIQCRGCGAIIIYSGTLTPM